MLQRKERLVSLKTRFLVLFLLAWFPCVLFQVTLQWNASMIRCFHLFFIILHFSFQEFAINVSECRREHVWYPASSARIRHVHVGFGGNFYGKHYVRLSVTCWVVKFSALILWETRAVKQICELLSRVPSLLLYSVMLAASQCHMFQHLQLAYKAGVWM